MKKILTLLVMFLATASILTAQTPQLNYQMIVRNQKATDVTIGEKVFHENDLVYSTTVTGTLKVLTANGTNSAAVYVQEFSEATNMNGMLTIILDNSNTQNTRLEKIDWAHSKLCVIISDLGINDTTEILPVTYAYKTLANRDITTPRIVKYINGSGEEDVKRIDTAITQNEVFINALRDSVANAMKRHPGKVKELAIYFIGTVVPQDVEDAAQAVNKDVAKFVKDTVADYIKNHRTEAYNLVKYFIGQTTVEDVSDLWSAAIHSSEADDIVKMVVDSVNAYIARHPELAMKTAYYIVERLSSEQVFALQNYAKTSNPGAYNAAKDIFDSIIDVCMNNLQYQKVQCDVTKLCDLREEIKQFKLYGNVVCPTLNETSVSPQQFMTHISNPNQVDIESVWYEVSFPNSNYPTATITAQLAEAGSIMKNAENIPQDWAGRKFSVTPKMTAKCMDTETSGAAKEYECQGNACQCPNIASFTHTSDGAFELSQNHGIVLTATMTNNYYGNDQHCGFEYKDGNNWEKLPNTNYPAVSQDGLTVSDTLKMNFCGKTLLVRPYVECGDQKYYGNYENGVTVSLREFELFISPEPAVVGELTVRNGIHIYTQSIIDEFGGNDWPSVEEIVAKYSSYGVNPQIDYLWTGPEGFSQSGRVVNVENDGLYTVKCTITGVFNSSEQCELTKEVLVQ